MIEDPFDMPPIKEVAEYGKSGFGAAIAIMIIFLMVTFSSAFFLLRHRSF